MRLATVRFNGTTSAALVTDGVAALLPAADAADVIGRPLGKPTGVEIPMTEADLAPAVLRPSKIVCIGLNYKAHLEELGIPTPKFPTLFAKFTSSLVGAHDDIAHPAITEKFDFEVELGVVIGSRVHRADEATALAAIGGYTVTNDITMRDWQMRTKEWLQGKTLDASTPVGPVIVSPDEIDHARNLEVRCEVDGRVFQRSNTADLLFSPAAIVAYISQFAALNPGDLILTGTPSGVGDKSGHYLAPGEVVRTVVEGIGECVNTIVKETVAGEL